MFLYAMKQKWNIEEEIIEFDRRYDIQHIKLYGKYFANALDRHMRQIYGLNYEKYRNDYNITALLAAYEISHYNIIGLTLHQPPKFRLIKRYDEYNTIIYSFLPKLNICPL